MANKLQYVILICKQKKKDKFLKLLTEYGAQAIDTIYGKGSAQTGVLAGAFGLDGEVGRAVLSALLPTPRAAELLAVLCDKHGFDKANTGIAFTIPVEGLAF